MTFSKGFGANHLENESAGNDKHGKLPESKPVLAVSVPKSLLVCLSSSLLVTQRSA